MSGYTKSAAAMIKILASYKYKKPKNNILSAIP